MTEVEFLQDYRGVLTKEQYYVAGQRVVFQPDTAHELHKRGIVDIIVITKTMVREDETSDTKYKAMTIIQLREEAKERKIRGYGRMKRKILIEKLK